MIGACSIVASILIGLYRAPGPRAGATIAGPGGFAQEGSPTMSTPERQAAIDEYVRSDAVAVFASRVADFLDGDEEVDLDSIGIASGFDDLWPADDDLKNEDHILASMRSNLLVARLFTAVARNPAE